MPHKLSNDSNSTLASGVSNTSDQVIATQVRASNSVRRPPVIIHNKGGQIYDETRPSDWDKQRWK
ncbi:hypothetical protein POX_b02587 [Penicillium oxalicum]|uniref:Uncharacterized protein n=1 Tax=Penicillium oxalicum (strain 114-2 / CGMCC 5302) TaxID=933388 RepID=S7ZJE3_PENO1|nr:hypothetical protein POX_b02587 [Penicillium oxalicum]EPS30404.1 hypothetical protein PDE_05355 [Penicillium oxalicum 114-2]KAI2792549.1 hypothetical protein POX_b02587 [Penicillium oxalicum]